MKSSVLISGEAVRRGSPELSPVKEGSKAKAINPRSAILIAYRPELCSLVAPKGPDTASAGNFVHCTLSLCTSAGIYMSATNVKPYWVLKDTFLWFTFSLSGKTLSHVSFTHLLIFSFVFVQAAKVITASIRVKNLLIFSFLSEIRCKVTTKYSFTQTQIARIYTTFAYLRDCFYGLRIFLTMRMISDLRWAM